MINWKVRIKNPMFWLTLIPAILLLVQVVLAPFGIMWDYTELAGQLAAIVDALFAVLATIGIVTDMTTAGIKDSELAMTYEAPKVG